MDYRIRAVFFDLGGVYYTEGFSEGLFAIARRFGLEERTFYGKAMEVIFATGYVWGGAPEVEFWNRLSDTFNLGTDLYNERGSILSAFKARKGMAELIARIREFVPVGLLTDQTNWLYELDERDGLLSSFDTIVNSYEEGYTKRDPEIFRIACQRFGILPEEAAFFDDDPGNIERGREFGIRAYLFEDTAKTEAILRAEGVDI